MPSSLLNAPSADTSQLCSTLRRTPSTTDRDARELKARAFYLEQAAKGNAQERAEARLMLRMWKKLSGWYRREHGDVIGELSQVVREREKGDVT
jgi:hypothetical protein